MTQKQSGNLSAIFPGGFHAARATAPGEPPEAAFLRAMEAEGLDANGALDADGRLHRVKAKDDSGGEKSGWYVFFVDGVPAGAFGGWRGGFWSRTWTAKGEREMAPEELAEHRRRMEALRRQREEEEARRHDEAAARALETWNAAAAADPAHAYLAAKHVQAFGVRQLPDGRLLVPRYNERGELRSYQTIAPDGAKRFLSGAQAKATFFVIGDIDETVAVIRIAEGYATAASIHEATGQPVVVAFDCGNLLATGEALRRRYPKARLVFCADNDQWKPETGNAGVVHATAAARGIQNASVVIPHFRDTSTRPTDFNDLALLESLEAVRRQLVADAEALDVRPASRWADREIPPRRWVWDGWIPVGQTTALYGDGGVGKTLLAQQMLTATATGQPFLGQAVMPGRALGIFCEDDEDELQRRQDGINRMLGLGFRDLGELYLVSRVGHDNLLMTFDGRDSGVLTGFWHQLAEQVGRVKPTLLVIDTAADTFGGNENIRPQVRQYIQGALTRIATEHHCAVLLCAHPSAAGLSSGEGTGGSTAWSNSVRSRLYLNRDPDTDRTTLTRKKANYAAAGEAVDLVWNDGAFIPYQSAQASDLPTVEKTVERDFLAILDELNERGTRVSNAKNGGRFAPAVIAKVLKQRGSKKWTQAQLEAAMERLFACRAVRVEFDERNNSRWLVVTGSTVGDAKK